MYFVGVFSHLTSSTGTLAPSKIVLFTALSSVPRQCLVRVVLSQYLLNKYMNNSDNQAGNY